MVKLVVLDLDNTLYDWVSYFVPAFDAMVETLVAQDAADEEEILESLQRVHQAQGTTEYAFALTEADVLHGLEEYATNNDTDHPAIEAFRRESSRRLCTYHDVPRVLQRLRDGGRTLVAYTDAMVTYADWRLDELGIAHYFDQLVATEDHAIPEIAPDTLAWIPRARFEHRAVLRHTSVPGGERKPNPRPLQRLLRQYQLEPHEAAFVGDSLTRDVMLAQVAGVHDVFAAYGRSYDAALWDRLVAVTHWTAADVARETELSAHRPTPSWTINAFGELPDVIARIDASKTKHGLSPQSIA